MAGTTGTSQPRPAVRGRRGSNSVRDDFTSISRDQARICLCRGAQGRGAAWLWIGVEDVEALHEELKGRGVTIRLPPTNYPWGLEMNVEDPDGNVIRFGSDPDGD